jgi:hypothetical protein
MNMPADFVTIVSGAPRSGTSLMMQMLQAGGMLLLTDGQRVADEHNPRGYFELEAVKHSRSDLEWMAQAGGRAVKVIHLLLPQLPPGRNYRVVFMVRELAEVVASQRAMLKAQGRVGAALADDKLAGVFQKQLTEVRQWLSQQPNFQVLEVNYHELLGEALAGAKRIAAFLGGNLNLAAMAGAVEPALYRQRRGEGTHQGQPAL